MTDCNLGKRGLEQYRRRRSSTGHIHMDNPKEVHTFVAMMKEVGRYAEKAGVVIALEDWISAEDNLRLLHAIGSEHLGVHYDARNIKVKVHDPYDEVRRLGRRSHQVRVKNREKLPGEPDLLDWPRLAEEFYSCWYVLENGSPSGDLVADARRNTAYVRKTFRMPAAP